MSHALGATSFPRLDIKIYRNLPDMPHGAVGRGTGDQSLPSSGYPGSSTCVACRVSTQRSARTHLRHPEGRTITSAPSITTSATTIPAASSVVLVHGTRTSSAIWAGQVEALSLAGHRGITIDLPGHGTRAGEHFTLRGALRAIDEAVVGCPEPPVLVGLSLGGYLALAYAARHHGAVAGVVLSGCSTEIRGKPLHVYRRLWPYLARALGRSTGWNVVTEMLDAMRGYSSLADLRRLLVPVWLVNGRSDPLRFEERRFLAANPAARLTVVPRAGHDVNLHAPAAFNRVLLGAVRELAVLR